MKTTRVIRAIELLAYATAIALSMVVSAEILYTKLIGFDYITFYLNKFGEHGIEAVIFPIGSLLALVFLMLRARNFWI